MPLIRPRSVTFSLLEVVAQGEGLRTEFKRLVHSPAKIARSISAFANTSGGHILIGVDDDGRIVGIRSEKETLEVIDDALRFHIDPVPLLDVHVEEYKRRMVLVLSIPESVDKPHFHVGQALSRATAAHGEERRVYIREGSHNKAATDDRIVLIQSGKEPLKLSFSDRESRLLDYLGEHQRITAPEFAEQAGIPVAEARRILVTLVRTGAVRLLTEGNSAAYALG
jgi:predicted HTH transcriptional regulator